MRVTPRLKQVKPFLDRFSVHAIFRVRLVVGES